MSLSIINCHNCYQLAEQIKNLSSSQENLLKLFNDVDHHKQCDLTYLRNNLSKEDIDTFRQHTEPLDLSNIPIKKINLRRLYYILCWINFNMITKESFNKIMSRGVCKGHHRFVLNHKPMLEIHHIVSMLNNQKSHSGFLFRFILTDDFFERMTNDDIEYFLKNTKSQSYCSRFKKKYDDFLFPIRTKNMTFLDFFESPIDLSINDYLCFIDILHNSFITFVNKSTNNFDENIMIRYINYAESVCGQEILIDALCGMITNVKVLTMLLYQSKYRSIQTDLVKCIIDLCTRYNILTVHESYMYSLDIFFRRCSFRNDDWRKILLFCTENKIDRMTIIRDFTSYVNDIRMLDHLVGEITDSLELSEMIEVASLLSTKFTYDFNSYDISNGTYLHYLYREFYKKIDASMIDNLLEKINCADLFMYVVKFFCHKLTINKVLTNCPVDILNWYQIKLIVKLFSHEPAKKEDFLLILTKRPKCFARYIENGQIISHIIEITDFYQKELCNDDYHCLIKYLLHYDILAHGSFYYDSPDTSHYFLLLFNNYYPSVDQFMDIYNTNIDYNNKIRFMYYFKDTLSKVDDGYQFLQYFYSLKDNHHNDRVLFKLIEDICHITKPTIDQFMDTFNLIGSDRYKLHFILINKNLLLQINDKYYIIQCIFSLKDSVECYHKHSKTLINLLDCVCQYVELTTEQFIDLYNTTDNLFIKFFLIKKYVAVFKQIPELFNYDYYHDLHTIAHSKLTVMYCFGCKISQESKITENHHLSTIMIRDNCNIYCLDLQKIYHPIIGKSMWKNSFCEIISTGALRSEIRDVRIKKKLKPDFLWSNGWPEAHKTGMVKMYMSDPYEKYLPVYQVGRAIRICSHHNLSVYLNRLQLISSDNNPDNSIITFANAIKCHRGPKSEHRKIKSEQRLLSKHKRNDKWRQKSTHSYPKNNIKSKRYHQ